MDFSDSWKAYFPIDFVPCAPLLLPESVVRSTIGPLLFSPSPGTRRTVSPSPSAAQVKSDDFSSNNNLGFIKCPDNDILLFFPTGDNLHKLGSAKLSLKVDAIPKIFDPSDCDCRSIVKIMVISVWKPAKFGTLGYLSACTTHSVHWFKIDWDRKEHRHVLVNLGSEQFDASVLHACWNPHAPRESLVLLDSGEFILFGWWDIPDITRFDVEWKDSDLGTLTSDTRWLSCEFGWHPRIFVIACSDVVYEVNGIWHDKYTARILAKIESFADMQLAGQEELLAGTHEPDEFVTFCRAGPRGFNFAIASRYGLYLIDTRQPLSPVIQWCHHLGCRPTYMQVFQLSELRSKADRDEYQWATESGFAILLGSFLDDDFSFFFYGPPVPAPPKSLAFKVADLCHTLYAWGHPSYISLSGPRCYSGDCLIQEELSKARRPKRKIVGFCVITEDLLDFHLESGGGCSFGLIRLLPSGKIESQMYNASWEFDEPSAIPAESPDEDFRMEDFRMDSFQRDDIDKANKHLELDNLLPYLHGDLLAKVIKEGAGCTQPFTQEKYKYLHDHLKAASVGQIGSLPDIVKVLTSVSVPMSINEIAVSRMWTGLSISALQLGFSSYPELPQFKASMDFLHIPKSPQLPPFLLRKPSQEVQPGDDLLGPVLPLPVLVNLRKVEMEMGTSAADKNEDNEFSLTHQCNEIMRVAMGLPGSSAELPDSHAVSLDDDMDGSSSVFQEVKSLVFYKPTSSESRQSVEQPVPEDTSATFIMKANTSDVEMFDDLCPIELKFDSPSRNFGKEELEALKLLKKRILSWQRKYKPYQALVGRQA